jgi:NADPH:quinone reductase-like Zn-dependent oxidoreductase
LVGGGTAQFLQAMLLSMTGNKKMVTFVKKSNQKDLVFIKELLEAGKVVPAIDRRYPLSEVPEAIRYLEKGHAKGKVVVTVN